jgi:hypothetical protein
MRPTKSSDLVYLIDRVDQLEAELVQARLQRTDSPLQKSQSKEVSCLEARVRALSMLSIVAWAVMGFLLLAMKPHVPGATQWPGLAAEVKAVWWISVTVLGGISVYFTFAPEESGDKRGRNLSDYIPLVLAVLLSAGVVLLYPRLVGEIAETKLHFSLLWLACLNSGAILSRKVSMVGREELPQSVQALNALSVILLALCALWGWGFVVVSGWAIGKVEPVVTVLLLTLPSIVKHLRRERA